MLCTNIGSCKCTCLTPLEGVYIRVLATGSMSKHGMSFAGHLCWLSLAPSGLATRLPLSHILAPYLHGHER